jgi:hypothetical protein
MSSETKATHPKRQRRGIIPAWGNAPGVGPANTVRAESPAYLLRAWIGLSALVSFCIPDLGRCPRLVWGRAFGPVRKHALHHP